MSAYFPHLENLPIFDASQFSIPNGDTAAFLTKSEADRSYLQYPFGQGEQNIPELIVAGSETIGADIIIDGTANTNYIEYPDNTRQCSANTGAGSLAGSYTNTNMTIDTNGKNTDLASGSAPVNLLPSNNTWTGTNTFQNFINLQSSTNIRGANTLNLYDRESVPTQSIAFQDVGNLTIENDAKNGTINLNTTNSGGTTTTSLSLNKSKGATFLTDTYVGDSTFVLRDNDTTTTQVNMSYVAGQQSNFNLAPSTLNPTTSFISYLDPANTPITPLQITNSGIKLQGTAPIIFPNSTIQNSAFTGGTAGTYTNTNMHIDSNGKILAISNGSVGATPTLSSVLTAGNFAGSSSINMNNNAITGVNNLTLQTGSITYFDTKVQDSAFKGAGASAGSYTNTNMTIDANGKISAISSGSAGVSQNLASVLATTPNAGNGGNLSMTGISSITLNSNTSAINFGAVSRAVQSSDYNNVAVQPISMETMSVKVTGITNKITLTMTLAQNYASTSNYMVFPSAYYGHTGSSGTYNAQGTASALNNSIIFDRNPLNFKCYCAKATNDNVNIYITFLVVYNGGGSNYPASYP